MCQEQPGLSCHTADNPVFAQAGALAATAALALPVPAPRSRAAPSFPGDTRPCAWSGYLWHLPGQGQDRGTVSLVPSVPGSGWIPVEWATSPVPRAALPPGTGCHSRAGGAVPGRSALLCAGGWGRTSLSLSSLSPTGSPSRPPAARARRWCRADPGSPQLRVLGSHLPRAQPLGAPVPARGWRWLVWGRRCAVAARLFCVSGQVSGACFTVRLSQSPQVMPRSQEHSTPAAGRVLAPGLAPGRVEAPPPQERALES